MWQNNLSLNYKQPQFQYFQFIKHFKVAQLNMNILYEQFIAQIKEKGKKKYGNLRVPDSYNEYKPILTRSKWFFAGMLTTIAAIVEQKHRSR